ncbi:MAG: ABC transporter substrate-binding protein [Gammaproteobacteria bacterium]|nr:ABC transporter substrate-binding protein [Gammaproteobacteria bacterium]
MPADQSANSDALVISGSAWITDAPTRIAAAANLFKVDSGPPIRVELADSGRQSLERLMAGQADFALMASVPLAMALVRLHHEDAPIEHWPVILASVGLSSRTHHVIADASRGIEAPADLAGHAVGLLPDTSAHFGWDYFAEIHGIDTATVQLVATRPDALAAGLAAGRFDAVVSWTPFSEAVIRHLGTNARKFPLLGIDTVSWMLVTRRATLAEHPDALQRVLRGYAAAIDLLQTEPARAATLLDLAPDSLHDKGVTWKLTLDWPVIANMESKLEWSAGRLDLPPVQLSPRHYIAPEPLQRFRPRALALPVWIPADQAE